MPVASLTTRDVASRAMMGVLRSCRLVVLAAGLFLLCLAAPASAQLRPTQSVPSPLYFASFAPFYAGDYKTALRAFNEAGTGGGVQTVDGRWIDWICYHTMAGECHYHVGNLPAALDQYEAALKLAIAHNGWMLRVQYPEAIVASGSAVRARINWGVSTRQTVLAGLPERMSVMMGRLDNENVVRTGGVIQPPQLYPVRVQEIVRCTALALRRRKELLGPIGPHDPLTTQLIQTFGQRSAPANHWSQAWISVNLGLAYATAGRGPQAATELQKSLLISGQFDHPLTPTALLELGKLQLEQGNHQAAGALFLEATLAAGQFHEADIVEEGFRLALTCHLASNQRGAMTPLTVAMAWAKSNDFRHLQSSLATMIAENLAVIGQTPGAVTALAEAQRLLSRRELQGTDVHARFNYIAALIAYQQGQIAAGDANLASAMAMLKSGSRRLYQIGLVDKMFLAGLLTPRVAGDLFALVLRDPTPSDWMHEPMETLAVSLTPLSLPLEHWFEILLERKEIDRAIEVADLARRQRFYATLPMGGRLLSLQWLVGAPEGRLGDAERLQRQTLLGRYPKLALVATKMRERQRELSAQPLLPVADQAKEHEGAVAELATLATAAEVMLREIALRREPATYVFPPIRKTSAVQEALAPGQAMLIFFNTQLATHVFAVNRERYGHWRLEAPTKIARELATLMRDLGQYDRNQPLTVAQISDTRWRTTGAEIFKLMFKGIKADAIEAFDELVIVPDGAVWYIPFEALQVETGAGASSGTISLLEKWQIRYSPTVGLAVPDAASVRGRGQTAVIMGRFFPKDDDTLAEESVDMLREVLPNVVAVTDSVATPSSLLAKLAQRMVVLADVDDQVRGAYEWAPAVIDKGKAGGSLAAWLALPWGGPEQVVLPGYHTAAEYGLKRGGVGDELFLPAMSFMATGSRTVLLSRWRVGGQTCHDLMREFVQELPHTSAANAWQRAVQLSWQSEIDFEREPRIARGTAETRQKADHPFLWAGYIVIDTGASPTE